MISVCKKSFGRLFGMLVIVVMLMGGCTTFNAQPETGSEPQSDIVERGPVPLYYDFGDVLVPQELKVDRKSSFVFQTPGLAAGVLALKGRVEPDSLIGFFQNNMVKDNWRLVSSFKSMRTIMLFQKENRWCVINITEEEFNTYVEIWVAPTIQGRITEAPV